MVIDDPTNVASRRGSARVGSSCVLARRRAAQVRGRHDPGEGHQKSGFGERLIIEISITTTMVSSNSHVAYRIPLSV